MSKMLQMLCILLFILCGYMPVFASVASLEKTLEEKQSTIKRRKTLIKELSEEERKTRADLRKSEKSIEDLEDYIAKQQNTLTRLEQKEKRIRFHLQYLQRQQETREKVIGDLLNILWALQVKQYAVESEEENVYQEEREYIWVQYLMQSIEQEYKLLEKEKKQTEVTLEEQRNNYLEHKSATDILKGQLETLLTVTIEYNKKIRDIRQSKQSAEEELKDIVKVIISIENQLQEKRNIGKIIPNSKGKLPWPVIGTIQQNYRPNASPPVKGIGFTTQKGESVKAIADGTVVHNDILRGFGRVVILSHGKQFYSVYAFLSHANLNLNVSVKQGQSLGTVGFYPAVNSDGLYFELRKNETTLNPRSWLKQ